MIFSFRRQAQLFRLLAHPLRLQILDMLRRDDEECVCHIQAALSKPQPYISQQLALLRDAGVIQDRKDGLNVYYRLKNGQVAALLRHVLDEGQAEVGHPEGVASRIPVRGCPCPKCQRA